MLPPVNRQSCKARSGGICVFVRDFFYKYVHVNDPFTNSSHCVFWFTIDERLLLQKTLFGVVYIPPDNSIYSNIDMFNDIENTLLDNDLQACLIGDFNAHTGNVSEYHCY